MLQSVSPKHDLPLKPEGQAAKPERTGTWAPFSIQAFRIIWICNLFANLGTWAQSVAAAWVVTDAHASPLMVAMIQVAAALPLVLLSILSGVIADNHDRRKIMLWGLSFEMTGAMFATLLAFLGYLDPVLLIISILWISLGGSVTIPAWQAAVNEQVPARMVSDAVLLNSVNYNVARAAGPALGGLLLSAVGPAWVFLFNSFCYMALIWAIWQWRRDVPKRSLPPEGILEGVTAALRFTQYSTVTRLVMMRSFAFGLSASAVWALLPLLAHRNPDGDAAIYGYMLGALGLGAILGSTQVSRLRQRIGSSRLISLAGFTLALILLTLGLVDNLWVLFPVLILGGGCWIGALATYNSAVQILVPDWIKARALALYQTALYGGLALGSFLWGHLAETMTVHGALLAAGCLLLASVILLYNSRLPEMDAASISRAPASMPGQPSFVFNTRRGMVLVSIEYRIPAERTRDFVRAAQPLRRLRLRNGAERWSLFRDVSNPEVWQELFLVDNWIQHLRMLDRMTLADKIVIDNVERRHAVGADHRRRPGLRPRGGLALGRGLGGGALPVLLFLLAAGGLARRLEFLRPLVGGLQFLDVASFEVLLEVAFDARHQVPVAMADQRDRQALGAGATGPADAVHVLVAAARHVEVDHQVQAFDVQAACGDVGGDEDLHRALLQALDGQLAVLLVLLAMQDEDLVLVGDQPPGQAIGGDPGIGEDDGLGVGLVAQQPLQQLFLVRHVVGGDDLLADVLVQLADLVQAQHLRLAQHLGDHLVQSGAAVGGGEQQGLALGRAGIGQGQHVVGEAHVEHAVGLVQHQHLDVLQRQVAGVALLEQAAGGADDDLRVLAQARALHLEVLAASDQAGLDEGELGEALDFLEGLLGQLAGRQEDQRARQGARLVLGQQAVQQRQQEGRGLAAAGLRRDPQVVPLQRLGNGRGLDRRRLAEGQAFQCLQQAFVEGKLAEQGKPRHCT